MRFCMNIRMDRISLKYGRTSSGACGGEMTGESFDKDGCMIDTEQIEGGNSDD